jgi:hypothetical protein
MKGRSKVSNSGFHQSDKAGGTLVSITRTCMNFEG